MISMNFTGMNCLSYLDIQIMFKNMWGYYNEKEKTSKSSKNFSRLRERTVRNKRGDVNKSRVSIEFGNNTSLEWEKWTRFSLKTCLFNASVHIVMQVILTLMQYFLF